uniref:Glycerophosphodiester phosphodiesterase domain containing 5 n=1 Tax=Bos indicus x Bos taurus TaxID=30522 RepID=A0A4W2EJY6_BOBOX
MKMVCWLADCLSRAWRAGGAGCLGNWQEPGPHVMPDSCPPGPPSGPGTMPHRRGATDELALASQDRAGGHPGGHRGGHVGRGPAVGGRVGGAPHLPAGHSTVPARGGPGGYHSTLLDCGRTVCPRRAILLPDSYSRNLLHRGVCPLPGPSHHLLSLHHGEKGPGPQTCPHRPPRGPHDKAETGAPELEPRVLPSHPVRLAPSTWRQPAGKALVSHQRDLDLGSSFATCRPRVLGAADTLQASLLLAFVKLAPEHTLMSFRKALEQKLYGLQADVTISLDGVPFLMHDATLRRTTNVEEEFPELARRPASMLNWTILQRLNAGQWFLKTDPFWTASSLSPSDHREAQNQSICRLVELLELAKGNATLLLNLRDPPREHPYRSSFLNITLEALLSSGFPQHQVLWLPNRQRPLVRKVAPGFQQMSGSKEAAASLRRGHIQRLNLRYTQVSRQELRDYASWNLSVNLYTVNAPWLFSLLWCAGVPSVTSDNSHTLSQVPSPLWIMPPDEYCLLWVTADLISFTLIVGIFVLQKWRLGGIRSYNPEQIMLSAAVHRTSRDVSIMKEKLIFSEISDGMEVSDELSVCSDNSYDSYANSATTPVAPRGSGSRAKTLTDRSGR